MGISRSFRDSEFTQYSLRTQIRTLLRNPGESHPTFAEHLPRRGCSDPSGKTSTATQPWACLDPGEGSVPLLRCDGCQAPHRALGTLATSTLPSPCRPD